ncbi:MAG: tetratricopeptide repeat protein [Algisphaera sp.]
MTLCLDLLEDEVMSVDRARILLQQRRPDTAETELRRALANDPDDGEAYALLGACLAELGKRAEAKEALGEAIRLAPEASFPHYALGHLRCNAGELPAAREAAREAMRLDPTNADPAALMAQIEVEADKWDQALAWAERGLALDAEHGPCANLRGIALTKLRRGDEAAQAIDATLRANPDDPTAHANRGWQCLHASQPKKALGHFREALRLEPGHNWARAGLVEALKARNPIYRLLLGYFLWMGTLKPAARNGLVIGGYVGYRLMDQAAERYPEASPYLRPFLWAYLVFVLLTWVGVPLFNLLLRLSPYGRHALDQAQKRGSDVFGLMLLVTLATGVGYWWTSRDVLGVIALVVGVTTLPVSGWMTLLGTTRFRPVGLAVAGVALLGLAAIAMTIKKGDMMPLLNVWLIALLGLQLWIVFGGRGRVKD